MQETQAATTGQVKTPITTELGTKLSFRGNREAFAMIPEETITDRRMTPAALGILNYLILRAKMPGGWTFYTSEIAGNFNTGRSGGEVRARLNELEDLGYIRRTRVRDPKGRLTGQEMAVSPVPIHWDEPEKCVQDGIASTSRFPSCGQPSRGKLKANQIDTNQMYTTTSMSADADLKEEEQQAETEKQEDEQGLPTSVSTKKRKVTSVGAHEVEFFVAAWNENRLQTPAWSWTRSMGVLGTAEKSHLNTLLRTHDGDVDAAVATFARTVRWLASISINPRPNLFWANRSNRPGIKNLLPNLGTWMDRAAEHPDPADLPAPAAVESAPVTTNFKLRRDQL